MRTLTQQELTHDSSAATWSFAGEIEATRSGVALGTAAATAVFRGRARSGCAGAGCATSAGGAGITVATGAGADVVARATGALASIGGCFGSPAQAAIDPVAAIAIAATSTPAR